jgi:selT/selW/selH-like putative selenoprotein
LTESIKSTIPELVVDINPIKPRYGSFECKIVGLNDEETLIWSGIKKTPRKEKFPEHSVIIDALLKNLQN